MHIHHKNFIKYALLSVVILVFLMLLMSLGELLLYKATGIVFRPSSTEKEVQEFWDMKPSIRESREAHGSIPDNYETRNVDAQISHVWSLCEKDGVKDYDRDGKVNCCDRATAFCIKWKKLYDRKVRLCQLQTNLLNHMFVQLYIPDYGWWSVEPAYATEDGEHDMELV